MDTKHIEQFCKEVLINNRNGDHTMPAPHLYPHQWLWDSCFSVIGLRHFDTDHAEKELLQLMSGQWSNGMIPHMIFDQGTRYAREREIWQSRRSPYSAEVPTSGITQPPVIAEALYRLGEKLPKTRRNALYKKILPRLFKYHMWLMTDRDPHDEGLALQIHPWETGLDNNPVWMNQLHEHSKPWWIVMIEKLKFDVLFNFVRRDTRHVPPGQRITNIEALIVFDMIRRFRRKSFDIEKILHRSLFCIEDIGFNSILARNNQILLELAKQARVRVDDELVQQIEQQKQALLTCWDEQDGYFYSRDFITHALLPERTISSLLPLYSGVINKHQATRIVECLKNYRSFGANHPVPSVPMDNAQFNPVRYWQGPSWINTNWLIIDGLRRYGFNYEADELKAKSLDLVNMHGPYEYFSPRDGTPLGAANFSWTAALAIDLLNN